VRNRCPEKRRDAATVAEAVHPDAPFRIAAASKGGGSMKKTELEALFLDCDRLKALCEQMNRCHPCASRSPSDRPKARLQQARRNPQEPGPSPEDVRNNLRYLRRPFTYADLFRSGDSVEHQLENAIKQYRAHPSHKASILVEIGINRVGISGRSEEKLLRLVSEAKQLLSEKLKTKGGEGSQGDNVTGTIFEHSDFHGSALFLNLSAGALLTGFVDLSLFQFNDKVSSAELTASPDEVGGRLFLFQNDRFFGRYAKLDANAGGAAKLASLGSFMNDRTSSVLIYRKSADEISAALGSLVSASQVTGVIASHDELSPRGDPIFTWDLFPDGKDGHPDETWKMYIYIRLPVTVAVPHWFDYDAEIRYWIYPFVDQNGQLHASLEYYGACVEGGVITDDVLDGLMAPDGIPSSLGQVTSLISPATDAANSLSGPFSGVYLLPGRDETRGNTDDDVTVVLVQGMPGPAGPIL
jgi:hypothetical protein